MDTKSFKKKANNETEDIVDSVEETPSQGKLENLNKQVLNKDEEIKRLKAQLSEAQKVNKLKKGDIRAEVNRQGDVKLIKIGVDEFGKPIWRKANQLTDSEIQMRENYIQEIKQQNAKKNN